MVTENKKIICTYMIFRNLFNNLVVNIYAKNNKK